MLRSKIAQILLLGAFIISGSTAMAQTNGGSEWDAATINMANNAVKLPYYTADERELIRYINMVRLKPQLFLKTYVIEYLEKHNADTTDEYVKSLIADLAATQGMKALEPELALYDFAKTHAFEMGKAGKMGHTSPQGVQYKDRIVELRKLYSGHIGENCDYGNERPLDILMTLLIDQGVVSLGHRKNILNNSVEYLGVSIQPHKTYTINTVIEVAGPKKKPH